MSTTPARYQPTHRLIDDPQRLAELYWERGLTIREIAEQYAEVGRTRVSQAFDEHGIPTERRGDESAVETLAVTSTTQSERGVDPPAAGRTVDWSRTA